MNEFEQQYLPEAYRPLSPWAYFGLSILYSVPVIGWIFLIAHALESRNINKRNYARSFFCIRRISITQLVSHLTIQLRERRKINS